jgi:TetR/AcrR family transcriptional regulator, regulator of cefoperazone and chloramphenicol sensitivity
VAETRLFPFKPPVPPEPSTEEKILDAALTVYAQHGITATSFRMIAEEAGVSVGAVQHHFHTKADLTAKVDNYVLQVLGEGLEPESMPAQDAVKEAGRRMTRLIADHPRVMDYLGRALVEIDSGSTIGEVIFDGLTAISEAQGKQFVERGEVLNDLDYKWMVLNPLILRVGPMILRRHIERYLGEPFYTEGQLELWDSAITGLLRNGAFKSEAPLSTDAPELT